MKIDVLDRPATPEKFEKDGMPTRHYFKQWAVMTVDGIPLGFEFSNDTALPPGPAELSPRSFGIVNSRLQVTRPYLVSLVAQKLADKSKPVAA